MNVQIYMHMDIGYEGDNRKKRSCILLILRKIILQIYIEVFLLI